MRRLWLTLTVTLTATACAHRGPSDIATLASNSDRVVFEAGQKALEKHNWESARQYFKRVVDGFPQSELGPAARLGLGSAYFLEGGTANYILAIAQYRDFLTLFPSHPRAEEAQFQVAEAYFKQRNGPDRDQTATGKALQEYERLLEAYPGSGHLEAARQRIVTCRQSLARGEFLVGYFYQRTRRAYRSAIGRYETVLSDYPDFDRLDEVLFRISECLSQTGRNAEALPHLARLVDEFPNSAFAAEARKLREKVARMVTAAPPSPTPTPPPTPDPTPTPPPPDPSFQAQVSL